MEIDLKVPDIGDADKIELVSWNVSIGSEVSENQELCELVTSKAAFPLESPKRGILVKIYKQSGELVKIGETLALLKVSE